MLGRNKEPKKLTGDTLVRKYSMSEGSIGPKFPLREIVDQDQIDLYNAIQEATGDPLDIFAAPVECSGSAFDMSDPECQRFDAELDEEIKHTIEEQGGKLALARTLDENGDLKW